MSEFFVQPRGSTLIRCESLTSAERCAQDYGTNWHYRMADVIVDGRIVTTFYSHADSTEVHRVDHFR